ncbi:cell division protein SepF [Acetivibrio cellulolyticus]|uniref:cell division protein SepF n=1 Tax=Acetivibrio cellulolyticus TaxID=35830 RepID=UPI0001E2D474|nr:cell division protein SepF [Acetivibrio cellulolyticus]
MSKLFNKVLNFVGWETEEDEEELIEKEEELKEETEKPQFIQTINKRPSPGKVVNIHSSTQFKVVVVQPENFNDAQDICDHLKNKKPIVINLEGLEKDLAQRIIDFLSGAVYSLDGAIQKVSNEIFIIAPYNVDIMGDFKGEIANKTAFPWAK